MSQDRNGKAKVAIKRRDMLKAFSIVPAALIPLGTAVAAEQKTSGKAAVKAPSAYQRKTFADHECPECSPRSGPCDRAMWIRACCGYNKSQEA